MISIAKLAVLGPKGTFSDMAASKTGHEAIYFNSHDEVFGAIADGKTNYVLVAFENQLTGTIMENLEGIIKNKLIIIKEIIIPIHHNLCVLPDSKEIKKIYSHPQGFMQCKAFLSKSDAEKITTNSTVEAFEIVMSGKMTDSACIGPGSVAEIYNLKIKNKNIEDFHHNQTRFFVLSKNNIHQGENKNKGDKTSIIFTVRHEPGSLVSCLQRLAKYDVNLTKIDSMPLPDKPWEYLFYCELESSDNDKLMSAIEELRVVSSFIRILGNYNVINECDINGNN